MLYHSFAASLSVGPHDAFYTFVTFECKIFLLANDVSVKLYFLATRLVSMATHTALYQNDFE